MSKKEAFDRQAQSSKKANLPQSQAKSGRLGDALKRSDSRQKQAGEAKEPAIKAKHTVVSGDTLSGLATKYYGSGSRENWMAIYEANKEEIGDNPSLIRVGQVLQIPELGE